MWILLIRLLEYRNLPSLHLSTQDSLTLYHNYHYSVQSLSPFLSRFCIYGCDKMMKKRIVIFGLSTASIFTQKVAIVLFNEEGSEELTSHSSSQFDNCEWPSLNQNCSRENSYCRCRIYCNSHYPCFNNSLQNEKSQCSGKEGRIRVG